jgi:ribosomal protein L21E
MSNFSCDICKVDIIEGPDGHYVTGCEHHPIDNVTLRRLKDGDAVKINAAFKYKGAEASYRGKATVVDPKTLIVEFTYKGKVKHLMVSPGDIVDVRKGS